MTNLKIMTYFLKKFKKKENVLHSQIEIIIDLEKENTGVVK